MKYSVLFPKSSKREFKEDLSTNAVLLTKAGYVDQLMAGGYTLLPLGFRVIKKINDIIREELNKTGAQEMLMPLLHPREIWDTTGRWSDPEVKKIMYQFEDIHGKEYGLSFTHEEIVMNLIGKYVNSYKDLPIKIYHFSTKFRNEPRAKSGILRTREFMMKDLYSAHTTEEDMYEYYNKIKEVYLKIFKRIGFDTKIVEASGGVFTNKHTHEFQLLSEVGEDEIYYCDKCDFAKNNEIYDGKEGDKCPNCKGNIKKSNSIEVGNIFPLGTKYSKAQKAFYKDKDGKENPIWLASYGIGPTRVMGALVETFSDERGIIWPESVTPFQVYLIGIESPLRQGSKGQARIRDKAWEVYNKLNEAGIKVLYDDRQDISPGEKFANADLLGFPVRLVVSEKAGNKIEFKERTKEKTELLSLLEVTTKLGDNQKE